MDGESSGIGHRGMASLLCSVVIRYIDVLVEASALALPDSPSTTLLDGIDPSDQRLTSSVGSRLRRPPIAIHRLRRFVSGPFEPAAERPSALAPSVSPNANRVTAATRKKSASSRGPAIERFTRSRSRPAGWSGRASAVSAPRPEGPFSGRGQRAVERKRRSLWMVIGVAADLGRRLTSAEIACGRRVPASSLGGVRWRWGQASALLSWACRERGSAIGRLVAASLR